MSKTLLHAHLVEAAFDLGMADRPTDLVTALESRGLRVVLAAPSPHPETDSEWIDGKSPYAEPWSEDEMDSFWGFHAMDNAECETCRWLATLVQYLPPSADR